jgi:hypothetical protein
MAESNFRPVSTVINPSDAAYTANDVVGGLLTVTPRSLPAVLCGVRIAVGEASIALAGTLYFFKSAPTTIADNAAFTGQTAADNAKLITYYTLPTAVPINSFNIYNGMYGRDSFPLIPVDPTNGSIYVYYVTSSTPNFNGAAQVVDIDWYFMGGF